ncbi:hypothetical protein SRHO_G00328000 [Serrasalmus rhombeus]
MAQEKPVTTYSVLDLEVVDRDGKNFIQLPCVYTQDVIPVENVISSKDLEKWPYLRNVDIKEIDADVELLIGVNTPKAMEPWEIINSIGNGPYAVRTMLGWIVNGPLGSMGDVTNHHVVTTNRISVSEIEELLIKQYNQEFPETHYTEKREMSLDDKKFMKILTEQVTYENSHYYLPLPFRNDNVMMPNNREVAIRRAASLAKRLKGDKSFQAEYKQFMDKMLEQDYAEEIPLDQLHVVEGKIWYVPHHGVYHRRKGTLRVVFDCTSSFQNTSLNKELLQGPDLTNNLLGVLMRFRQGHIALMADIQAMFHQVRVHRKHVDFLRFLWWPDGDFEKQPEDYRMKVHLFGAISSPSCANFALQKTAQDNQHNYDKEVIETIQNNFYVDDCLKTADTEMHAIKLHKGLSDLCSTGGFKLTKWVSNSKKVLEVIPENERADMVKDLELDRKDPPIERVLGIQWNLEDDTFGFKVSVNRKPLTRRGILSTVSSIYDPLGFLAPFVLKGKQILQALCKSGCGWDKVISDAMLNQWKTWLQDTEHLSGLRINRCMKPKGFGTVISAQLHHFCDASEVGYGTVSYIRFASDRNVHVSFVVGKARVAPLKQMTIPRLELQAATLASRMDKMLRVELQMNLEPSVIWTESQSVLKDINNEQTRFSTFVTNRLTVIRDLTTKEQWRYVGSANNPADAASRGVRAVSLMSKHWWSGPDFLRREETHWPIIGKLMSTDLKDLEVRNVQVHWTTVTDNPTIKFLEYYSQWNHFKRALAWFLRLKDILKTKIQGKDAVKINSAQNVGSQCLSVDELERAENAVISYVQNSSFHEEVEALQKDVFKEKRENRRWQISVQNGSPQTYHLLPIDILLDSEPDEDPQMLSSPKHPYSPCDEMENLADIIRDFKRENISEHSTLTVVARRRRILHSAITALNKGYFDWHKRPQIEFVGEMADDYGGPTREFFSFVEDHDRMTSLNIMGNASKTLWTNKINFILLLFTFVVKLIIFEWMPQDDPR